MVCFCGFAPFMAKAQVNIRQIKIDGERVNHYSLKSQYDSLNEAELFEYPSGMTITTLRDGTSEQPEQVIIEDHEFKVIKSWPIAGTYFKIETQHREKRNLIRQFFYLTKDGRHYERWKVEKSPLTTHFKTDTSSSGILPRAAEKDCGVQKQPSGSELSDVQKNLEKSVLDKLACEDCLVDRNSCGDHSKTIVDELKAILSSSSKQSPKKYFSCLAEFKNLPEYLDGRKLLLKSWRSLEGSSTDSKIQCYDSPNRQMSSSGKVVENENGSVLFLNKNILVKNDSSEIQATLFHEILHLNGARSELEADLAEKCCASQDQTSCEKLQFLHSDKFMAPAEYLVLPGIGDVFKLVGADEAVLSDLKTSIDNLKKEKCDMANDKPGLCRQKNLKTYDDARNLITKTCKANWKDQSYDLCTEIVKDYDDHLQQCQQAKDNHNCLFDSSSNLLGPKNVFPKAREDTQERMGRQPAAQPRQTDRPIVNREEAAQKVGFLSPETKTKMANDRVKDRSLLNELKAIAKDISPISVAEAAPRRSSSSNQGQRRVASVSVRKPERVSFINPDAFAAQNIGSSSSDQNEFSDASTGSASGSSGARSGSRSRSTNLSGSRQSTNKRTVYNLSDSGDDGSGGDGQEESSYSSSVSISSSSSSVSQKSQSSGGGGSARNVTTSKGPSEAALRRQLLRKFTNSKDPDRMLTDDEFLTELRTHRMAIVKDGKKYGSIIALYNFDYYEFIGR